MKWKLMKFFHWKSQRNCSYSNLFNQEIFPFSSFQLALMFLYHLLVYRRCNIRCAITCGHLHTCLKYFRHSKNSTPKYLISLQPSKFTSSCRGSCSGKSVLSLMCIGKLLPRRNCPPLIVIIDNKRKKMKEKNVING